MRDFIDTASLVARAADNHLRFVSPAAHEMEPPQYAGKIESVCLTMALDVLGVQMKDARNPMELARFATGLSLMARANDEVVDEARPYVDELLTTDDLNNTPVFHKFAGPGGRDVTGAEGRQIALDATARMITTNGPGSKIRKDTIESLLDTYTAAVAATANNPDYHTGDERGVLPYDVAIRSSADVSVLLGETSLTLAAAFLDVPEGDNAAELYGQIAMAMQFGDDWFDWRKDWKGHLEKQQQAERPIRPQENLFIATLVESPDEVETAEEVLTDSTKRSIVVAKQVAPESVALFEARFQAVVDRFPPHQYSDKARRMVSLILARLLPMAPESGRFYRWAKY